MMKELSPELRAQIEAMLEEFPDPTSPTRRRFEALQAEMDERLRPLQDAIRRSEDITGEDLRIIVY